MEAEKKMARQVAESMEEGLRSIKESGAEMTMARPEPGSKEREAPAARRGRAEGPESIKK